MERGKLCRMGGRRHYNHQTWQDGRNVVRYVPADETEFLQEAIEGHRQFMRLAQQFADEVIKQTRKERERVFSKQMKVSKRATPEKAQKTQNRKIDS